MSTFSVGMVKRAMSGLLISLLSILVPSASLVLGSRIALRVPVENSKAQQLDEDRKVVSEAEEEEYAINWKRLLWISLLICVGMTVWLLITIYGNGPLVSLFSLLLIVGVCASAIRRIPTLKGQIVLAVVFAGTIFGWMLSPNWLSADAFAVTLIVCCLVAMQFRSAFYEVAFVLGVVALLYDAINVFATGLMIVGAKQSLEASGADILAIPSSLNLEAPIVAGLGTLDIILSGLLTVLAGRVAQRTARRAIYWAAIAGFAVGLCISGLVSFLMGMPQPATIYLVPSILAAVWLAAKRHGIQSELRRKMKKVPAGV